MSVITTILPTFLTLLSGIAIESGKTMLSLFKKKSGIAKISDSFSEEECFFLFQPILYRNKPRYQKVARKLVKKMAFFLKGKPYSQLAQMKNEVSDLIEKLIAKGGYTFDEQKELKRSVEQIVRCFKTTEGSWTLNITYKQMNTSSRTSNLRNAFIYSDGSYTFCQGKVSNDSSDVLNTIAKEKSPDLYCLNGDNMPDDCYHNWKKIDDDTEDFQQKLKNKCAYTKMDGALGIIKVLKKSDESLMIEVFNSTKSISVEKSISSDNYDNDIQSIVTEIQDKWSKVFIGDLVLLIKAIWLSSRSKANGMYFTPTFELVIVGDHVGAEQNQAYFHSVNIIDDLLKDIPQTDDNHSDVVEYLEKNRAHLTVMNNPIKSLPNWSPLNKDSKLVQTILKFTKKSDLETVTGTEIVECAIYLAGLTKLAGANKRKETKRLFDVEAISGENALSNAMLIYLAFLTGNQTTEGWIFNHMKVKSLLWVFLHQTESVLSNGDKYTKTFNKLVSCIQVLEESLIDSTFYRTGISEMFRNTGYYAVRLHDSLIADKSSTIIVEELAKLGISHVSSVDSSNGKVGMSMVKEIKPETYFQKIMDPEMCKFVEFLISFSMCFFLDFDGTMDSDELTVAKFFLLELLRSINVAVPIVFLTGNSKASLEHCCDKLRELIEWHNTTSGLLSNESAKAFLTNESQLVPVICPRHNIRGFAGSTDLAALKATLLNFLNMSGCPSFLVDDSRLVANAFKFLNLKFALAPVKNTCNAWTNSLSIVSSFSSLMMKNKEQTITVWKELYKMYMRAFIDSDLSHLFDINNKLNIDEMTESVDKDICVASGPQGSGKSTWLVVNLIIKLYGSSKMEAENFTDFWYRHVVHINPDELIENMLSKKMVYIDNDMFCIRIPDLFELQSLDVSMRNNFFGLFEGYTRFLACTSEKKIPGIIRDRESDKTPDYYHKKMDVVRASLPKYQETVSGARRSIVGNEPIIFSALPVMVDDSFRHTFTLYGKLAGLMYLYKSLKVVSAKKLGLIKIKNAAHGFMSALYIELHIQSHEDGPVEKVVSHITLDNENFGNAGILHSLAFIDEEKFVFNGEEIKFGSDVQGCIISFESADDYEVCISNTWYSQTKKPLLKQDPTKMNGVKPLPLTELWSGSIPLETIQKDLPKDLVDHMESSGRRKNNVLLTSENIVFDIVATN